MLSEEVLEDDFVVDDAPTILSSTLMKHIDLKERVEIMMENEKVYAPNPRYMAEIQAGRLRPQWRLKVAEWLLAFVDEFKLSTETVSMSLNFIDRYLSKVPSSTNGLEILAMVCIFVASKMNESVPIKMGELNNLAGGKFSIEDFKNMELDLFVELDWKLNALPPHAFVPILLHSLNANEQKEITQYSDVFLDLALCGFALLDFLPSTVAISSILCAYAFLGKPATMWLENVTSLSPNIKIYTPQVQDCIGELMRIFTMQFPDLAQSTHGLANATGSAFIERCISPISVMDVNMMQVIQEPVTEKGRAGGHENFHFESECNECLEIAIDML